MTNYFRPSTKPRATISIVCDVDEAKYRTVSNFQFNYLIWVQLFAMITAGLQAEIMGDAAPTIAKKFGAELKLSWMASSGFMVQVCSLLVLGRLYDFLEPKRILIFCCTCFITGSVISARATSFSVLIAGQAVAGLGRSGITVGAVLILAVICPDRKQRAIYLSIVTASYGIMLKIAPVISGLLLENHGTERWRWIFWICVPFQSVLLLLVCAFPPLRRRRASWQQCKDFDFFGALLQAVAMSSFIVPLLVGNTTGKYAWRSPVLIALYVLSPLLLMSFVYWESRKEERHRFIPLHAMCRNPSILALAVVAIASSSIVAATTFFMPQYLQLVRDSSPIVSALQLLPSIFLGSGASIMVGKLLAAKGSGSAQFICIFGSLCQIIGGLAFYFAPFQKNMLGFYAISLTIGFGAGSLFAIGITLVLEIMPDSAFGQITAFMNTATAIGSVLGVALQGVIVQTGMERILANVGGIETLRLLTKMVESRDDSMLSLVLGLRSGGNLVTTLSDLFVNFKADYHDTQRQASLLYAALGALSLLASLCLRSMGKDKMGGTISVHEGLDEEEYQQAAATLTFTLPVPVRRSVMSLDQTRASVVPQSVTMVADEKHFRRQTIVQSDASDEKTPEIREATTTVSSQDRPTCPTVVVTSPPATLTVPPLDSLKDDENIKHELELAISLDVHAAQVNSDTLS